MNDLSGRRAVVSLDRMFPRVHRSALGMAIGLTAGASIWLLTALALVLRAEHLPLSLLNQYFYGYDVTWAGAFVGFTWGLAAGFIGGWLLGFIHDVTLNVWLMTLRARTELSQRRNFLEHIR
jgi:hypothetical protein